MEKRIMRKHLIGAILVLAALAACNKEVDTPAPAVDNGQEEVTPGKVTLTFKATIDEGTRTSYDENLQGSWLPNDAISVCVTDRKNNYQTAVFTTEDGEIFSGQVSAEYTTIVSGVYPANDKHVFNLNNGKVTSVYLSDTYKLGTANDGGIALPMVGEMEEGVFTFHHICGALKIEVVDIFNTLTFTTAGETITGNFPLTNGRIAIPANGSASTVTFTYGRLETNHAVGERGNRTFYIPVPDGTLTPGAKMAIKNANNVSVFEKTASNNNGITFNSNVIKRFPVLGLNQRNDWTITPDLTGDHPEIHFDLQDQNEQYLRISTTKANFEDTYSGSVIEFIEKRINQSSNANTQTGSKVYSFSSTSQEKYFDDGAEKVYIMVGVIGTSYSTRTFTLDYQIKDFIVPDPATNDYLAWIGQWNVDDGSNTDTWTIARKETNSSYSITGLAKRSFEIKGVFNNGSLKLYSQLLPEQHNNKDLYLLCRSASGFYSNTNLLIMTLDMQQDEVAITPGQNAPGGYGFYTKDPESGSSTYVVRRKQPTSITRVPEQ